MSRLSSFSIWPSDLGGGIKQSISEVTSSALISLAGRGRGWQQHRVVSGESDLSLLRSCVLVIFYSLSKTEGATKLCKFLKRVDHCDVQRWLCDWLWGEWGVSTCDGLWGERGMRACDRLWGEPGCEHTIDCGENPGVSTCDWLWGELGCKDVWRAGQSEFRWSLTETLQTCCPVSTPWHFVPIMYSLLYIVLCPK